MSGCPCRCSTSAASPLSLLPTTPAPLRDAAASPSGPRAAAAASSKDEKAEEGDLAFNPFGFVTDNPSSRSAFQLPESPAQTAMSARCSTVQDKGREYGKSVRSGEFRWFVRQTVSPDARRGTIMFINGAPTQSFSYRTAMVQITGYQQNSHTGLTRSCYRWSKSDHARRRNATALLIFNQEDVQLVSCHSTADMATSLELLAVVRKKQRSQKDRSI